MKTEDSIISWELLKVKVGPFIGGPSSANITCKGFNQIIKIMNKKSI